MGILSRLRSSHRANQLNQKIEDIQPRTWITRNEARELFKICEEIFNKGYKTQSMRGRKKIIMKQINESYGKIKDLLGIKVIQE